MLAGSHHDSGGGGGTGGGRGKGGRWEFQKGKGREAGEIGGNYATLHNISQSKKGQREEVKKKAAGAGIARYRRRKVWTPLPHHPPPPQITNLSSTRKLYGMP